MDDARLVYLAENSQRSRIEGGEGSGWNTALPLLRAVTCLSVGMWECKGMKEVLLV